MASASILSSAPEVGSWAEEVQENAQSQVDKDGIRTVVDYVTEDDGTRYKIVTKFQIIQKKVPRVVADRKKWKKFGESERDPPGPQVSTTYVAEEVEMQFTRNRAGEQILDVQEDKQIIKATNREHCRYCKGNDHWSTSCPYKEMYNMEDETDTTDEKTAFGSKSIGNARGDLRGNMDRRSDENTCRVTNMPQELEEAELREMFSAIGKVVRVFIARDKLTNQPKGFAFVTYDSRQDAERAIAELNGKPKYHMILKVEWTRYV
ncbi:unnamed protein product [Auanema sp. JU1783]|nr:unnamed protein product [Auanema sp. JU1783]